MFTTDGASGIK